MYAVGVTEIDNMLMKLSVSSKMTEQERDTVIPFVLKVRYVFPLGELSYLLEIQCCGSGSESAVLRIRIRDPVPF
jgi:hypothetical protein